MPPQPSARNELPVDARVLLMRVRWFLQRRAPLVAYPSPGWTIKRGMLEERFMPFAKKAVELFGLNSEISEPATFSSVHLFGQRLHESSRVTYPFGQLGAADQWTLHACCEKFARLLSEYDEHDCVAADDAAVLVRLEKLPHLRNIWAAENHKQLNPDSTVPEYDEPLGYAIARAVRRIKELFEWPENSSLWQAAAEVTMGLKPLAPNSCISAFERLLVHELGVCGCPTLAAASGTRTRRRMRGQCSPPPTLSPAAIVETLRARMSDTRRTPDALAHGVVAAVLGVDPRTVRTAIADERRGMPKRGVDAGTKRGRKHSSRGRPTLVSLEAACTLNKAESLAAFHSSPDCRILINGKEVPKAPLRRRRRKT